MDIGSGITIGPGITIPGNPPAVGQQAYTTPGTYTWIAPAGVTSVSVVCIGGGGGAGKYYGTGGGGGGLGWKNNISVTPGQSYTVVVGAGGIAGTTAGGNGGDSYFIDTSTVKGGRGLGGPYSTTGGTTLGGNYVGDGGGKGGSNTNEYATGGGGGAGGYSGNGGLGGPWAESSLSGAYSAPAGGGGSGGAYVVGGGGVGLYGQGSGGIGTGQGGSAGSNGLTYSSSPLVLPSGGNYGGGGSYNAYVNVGGNGGTGAVRIIWGPNRAFPSTNTQDMS